MTLARFGRRALWSFVTLWAVLTLTFFVNQRLPADPARAIAGPQARPAEVAKIRVTLGLDRPVWTQYAIFFGRLVHLGPREPDKDDERHASCTTLGPVHLDLGLSYQKRRPVIEILSERFGCTLFLAAAAMLVQVLIGSLGGVIAAMRRNTWFDFGTVSLALVGISAPTFIIGMALQYVLAYRLRLLPLDGYGVTTAEHLVSVVLPAITLGFFGAAYYTRLVRDEMIVLFAQDFVRTARAKGASPFSVAVKHAFRNALMPLVTIIGLDFGTLVGGAIVTEKLFRWPGLGQLSVDAVFDRDTPVIMGTVIIASTAIIASSLLVDLSYALLDPRGTTS